MFGLGPVKGGPADARQRRRRQWFVAAISAGAAIIVIAICAGALAVVDAIDGVRDQASDAREARQVRDERCLELERRLNKLVPPGSTTTPAARAAAIRNENAAARIYLGELPGGDQDDWRQLLDARGVYAEALDRQAKTNVPAFYVAPRTEAGEAVTDDLVDASPATCAGSIRRLATPEL
ncbi:hypothetical protein Ade02nite_50410 [Paractinoplanes deccanensis]|uniref:Uncharacterized protein n=1 Tax=Paractinoplanes deccanensis TaxID=113561 RepID=A0ABQ3Y8S4_9ACTN|nr:hypothetical protein [Actinoplanes deccanensis]GID76400.1 hypothetical protein Ade02nite_50410 [Actinoplanes deccanensis]